MVPFRSVKFLPDRTAPPVDPLRWVTLASLLLVPRVFAAEPPAPDPAPPAAAPATDPAASVPEAPPPAAPVPVLVSAFQAANPEAAGLATLLEQYLARALGSESTIVVRRVEDAPAFADYSARVYMEGCPPGDAVGCALVIGDRAEARYAVTGTVLPLVGGARVQISIIDIEGSRVAVAFRQDVETGGDEALAEAVVKVIVAVAAGKLGAPDDIRDAGSEVEGPDGAVARASNAELATQLAELAPELGAAGDILTEPPRSIQRRVYTAADLAQNSEEVSQPWDLVGLTPGAWLRYKNSGLTLEDWRTRAMGHQLQLLLRAEAGWWRGPVDTLYYNRHAYDPSLTIIDSYSAEAARMRGVPTGGGEVAFGLLPSLDVGCAVGWAPGSLLVDIAAEGDDAGAADTTTVYPGAVWWGPRVEAALFPAGNLHPVIGVGATLVRTPRVDHLVALPEYADPLPSSWLVYGTVWPGVQVRLSRSVDFFARIPIDLLMAGDTVQETRVTTQASLVPTPPTADANIGVGAQAGIQVRLFGRSPPRLQVRDDEP